MPYNVIALTLAIMALGIGWVVDEVVQKRTYLLKNKVKTNIPTSVLVLTSILQFFWNLIKGKKNKKEEEKKEENGEGKVKDE